MRALLDVNILIALLDHAHLRLDTASLTRRFSAVKDATARHLVTLV